MRRSKSYLEKSQKLQPLTGAVTLPEAVNKIKLIARDTITLPHGTGRTPRVAVFAKGEKVAEARAAGADLVGLEEIVEQIQKGVIEFDIAIATPDVMKDVSKVAKVLGPRGLMPNPKSGTTTMDVSGAVKEFKAGKVNFRVEKAGIIHVRVGKGAFNETQLLENIQYLLNEINRLRPASAKGQYIRSIAVSATQSPGVRVDPLAV
jgi:large subunit ribosomal protein L1